jgi:DNA invertase Pin-like site-specific DNA recombinase
MLATSDQLRRAVVYRRISNDATGEAAGVGRQQHDCLRFCTDRGWDVVADLEDNDISASRYSRKKRPGYLRALALIEGGDADVLVSWHLDRLWRRPAELEHLIDLVEKTNLTVATLNGDIDLGNADGRFQARILVSVAAKASDDSSHRLRRKMQDRAEKGEPHGHRPFGWQPGGIDLDPVEAPILAEMVTRFLAGDGPGTIADWLNSSKVPCPQGGSTWMTTVVRAMLANPRLAGLRVHLGEVIGEGRWTPIIDRATHERILAEMKARAVEMRHPPRRRLLTGLVRCFRCGQVMTYGNNGKVRCVKDPGTDKCGGTTIRRDPLEALIVEAVTQRLDTPNLQATLDTSGDPDVDRTQLAVLEGRLDELAQMFAAGEVGRREWLVARRAIEQEVEVERRKQARAQRNAALSSFTPGTLRLRWPAMTVDHQRAILAAVIDRITILPAPRKGPVFNPDRVDVDWRV